MRRAAWKVSTHSGRLVAITATTSPASDAGDLLQPAREGLHPSIERGEVDRGAVVDDQRRPVGNPRRQIAKFAAHRQITG